MKAIFRPTNLATLRPGMEAHIGKVFTFQESFVLDDNEGPYGGQQTYVFARCHDEELGEHAGRWVPEQDLEFIE